VKGDRGEKTIPRLPQKEEEVKRLEKKGLPLERTGNLHEQRRSEMKRHVGVLLVFLAAAAIFLSVPVVVQAVPPTITGAGNYVENRGPNSVGMGEGLKFNTYAFI